MISVSEAQTLVGQHVTRRPPELTPLSTPALGLVLAEDIASDVDSPPYDKAMMDGYAFRLGDLSAGVGKLRVVEEITAGKTPTRALGPGEAARIMTGAPIPSGADAVVMHERTTSPGGDEVEINDASLTPGKNVLPRGQEMKTGDVVVSAGARLQSAHFGVLASVGRTAVQAFPAPRVTIVATGDELVDAPGKPGPGQIRNSNGPMLVTLANCAGGLPRYLGIARDNVEHLRSLVREGLEADVLILSGGVSAGKLDLVPGVLQELGVEPVFHKVTMKPGKPVFFGVREKDGRKSFVFGLPGNPVSSLVCFELFVAPALRKLAGHARPGPTCIEARLAHDKPYQTDRPTYHPARLTFDTGECKVQPLPWFGSPDLRALTEANAFVLFPPGEHHFQAGETFEVLLMSGSNW